MKVKIPLSEKNRYIDLMGDPIHQNKIKSTFLSVEFMVAAGVSALMLPIGPVLGPIFATRTLAFNSVGIGLTRGVERILLGNFSNQMSLLSKEDLDNICIDKNPSPEQKIESIQKYGNKAAGSTIRYCTSLLGALYSITATHDLTDNIAMVTRILRGMYRNSKIISGEWAVISMPKEQERIKKYLEFEIPDIKLPSPVPQPAREMV